MTNRQNTMELWLNSLGYQNFSLDIASEDASFRRYFRLTQGANSYIVMDAPPEKEPCDSFVKIARKLTSINLNAPQIIHENHDDGFLVLTDFGDLSYLDALNEDNSNELYGEAMAALAHMQSQLGAEDLPSYDEDLLRAEMNLFKEWFLEKLLGIELTQNQLAVWKMSVDQLVQNALDQPQVFVHRDYHSRNLMKLEKGNPGILDFQDAVKGPVSYDLVSLLRDCYVDWPEAQVDQWVLNFYELALQQSPSVTGEQFMRWFNLMGVQRHLKAIGIFSRLHLRDDKDKFLHDIPRTLNYLKIVGTREISMLGLYTLTNDLSLVFRMKSLLPKA